MSDLTITGSITRTELGLPALAFNDSTYKIIREMWGPGVVEHERQKVSSPYVHGDFPITTKKAQAEMILGLRVTGTGYTDCWNKVGILLRAFEQFKYNVTIVMEGTTFEYECEAADYSIGDGGNFQDFHFRAYKQEVRLIIPRRPVPLQGPV